MSALSSVLAAIAVVAAGYWILAGLTQAAGVGVIEGRITNGTPGGAAASGATVILNIVGDGDRVDRREATADFDGNYLFEGLDTTPSLKYLPVVEYQGAVYYPRPMTLADQPRQTADISIYESTARDQWIAFERSSLVIKSLAPNSVDVLETGALANVGDRTYIGPDTPSGTPRPTLHFTVPVGASDLAPQAGFAPNDFLPTADGFAIASPVLPGRHQFAFGYSLPFSADRLQIARRFQYPTATFSLYVPDVGLRIDSAQLKPQGQADLGGQKYLLYGAQTLPRGTDITIDVSGLPSSASGGRLGQLLAGPIVSVGFTVLGIGLVIAYRRRRELVRGSSLDPAANDHGGGERAELERMQLLHSLARLDERFERGGLKPEQYRRERESGKRRLLALTRQRLGTGADGE